MNELPFEQSISSSTHLLCQIQQLTYLPRRVPSKNASSLFPTLHYTTLHACFISYDDYWYRIPFRKGKLKLVISHNHLQPPYPESTV